jgi:hypothetical protein
MSILARALVAVTAVAQDPEPRPAASVDAILGRHLSTS